MNQVKQGEEKKYPVVCGFYGVGKSFLAKNYPNFFDIEVYWFRNNLDILIQIIKEYQNQHRYKITIVATKPVIELLEKNNIDFVIVVPSLDSRKEYMQRFKERNSPKKFITQMKEGRWEKELLEVLRTKSPKIVFKQGQHLHDVIGEIYGE